MTRQPGGFSLENIFTNGSSVEGAVANPYITTEDVKAGQRIFRERCAYAMVLMQWDYMRRH